MRITISGKPGAGKGEIRKLLSKKYNIPSFSVGDLRREYAKSQGMDIHEFNKYSEKNSIGDIKADKYQIEWAKNNPDFILEGRLSYHFIPDSIKIYLTGNPLVLAKRIINANRDSEKTFTSPIEQAKLNAERCHSDDKRYLERYGIKNYYNPDNFDIVLNTTHRSLEEVLNLVDKKIFDYNQKMNPLKLYLANPTESKLKTREWELEFEKRTGIELINPFFDCQTLESKTSSKGKEKYLEMGKNVLQLYKGDLEQITRRDILGSVVILDENWTWGTPSEQATLWLLSKPIYTLVLHPEKNYFNHPIIRWYSNKVFKTKEGLEEHLIKNKSKLFRELEKTRQKNLNNPTYQMIFKEMKKNEELLGM